MGIRDKDYEWGLGLGIMIGERHWKLGIEDCGLGIENKDRGLELGIWNMDWDWGF